MNKHYKVILVRISHLMRIFVSVERIDDMSKKRPRKDKCIEALLKEIRKGTEMRDAKAKYSKKWHYPTRTFSNHWYEAQDVYNKEREEINKKIQSQRIEAEKEAVKRDIMTRLDILERLSHIAKGRVVVTRADEYFEPSQAEQIRAMETINRMQGYNDADRLEVKNVDEFSKMTDEELHEYISKGRAGAEG